MTTLHDITRFLDAYLRASACPADQYGVLRPSNAPIARLGLALDPQDAMQLPEPETLGALLLHRWWGYDTMPLSPVTGVLGYHQPFDDRLTLSDNPLLVSLLGMRDTVPLHSGDGRIVGVVGDVQMQSAESMHALLSATFGGLDSAACASGRVIHRVAAMNAMTDALVRDAHARGAELYLTGQLRAPARAAVEETGMCVTAIGHARLERWALSCLAEIIREAFPGLEVVTTG